MGDLVGVEGLNWSGGNRDRQDTVSRRESVQEAKGGLLDWIEWGLVCVCALLGTLSMMTPGFEPGSLNILEKQK